MKLSGPSVLDEPQVPGANWSWFRLLQRESVVRYCILGYC